MSTARARRAPTSCSRNALLRMGVPVASRNIFPSNIQGLPTWYEVRVSGANWLGRRGGVDLMVAMNPQTWDKDVASIDPGGYLLYDSTKPLPPSKFRDDINSIGVPLTDICNRTYTDPRQRQLFKNIIYVGALASLLSARTQGRRRRDCGAVPGQGKAHRAEREGVPAGLRLRGGEHLAGACGLKVERATWSATASSSAATMRRRLGCVYGGATVAAWYPITPSTSLAEAFGALPRIPRRSRNEREQIRHRAGGRRDRRHRHGDRRRLERRARLHGHVGPRHFADAGILRARLFRGNSRRHLRHPARRAFHRHADAHAAIRHPALRLCEPWRHQACAAVPQGPGRGVRPSRPTPSIWPSGCRRPSS
jgi:hypothetical protein